MSKTSVMWANHTRRMWEYFSAVWHLMYTLVWLCAGLQDAFVSSAPSIYELLWLRVQYTCQTCSHAKKCSRVGWAYFCFSWYSHILKSLKENCESPSQSLQFVFFWFGDLFLVPLFQNRTWVCMWLKKQHVNSLNQLFVSLFLKCLDEDLDPHHPTVKDGTFCQICLFTFSPRVT